MDLSRAIGKFAQTRILYWDPIGFEWLSTGLSCRLQVYDRFISERSFGQKKRVLTIPGLAPLNDEWSIIRLGNSETVFLVESMNEDIAIDDAYNSTYSVREAGYAVEICKREEIVLASKQKQIGDEQVLATTWVDMDRYSAVESREFNNTDFTVYTVTFPKGITLDTDMYLKTEKGGILDINEIYETLELPTARCQKRG